MLLPSTIPPDYVSLLSLLLELMRLVELQNRSSSQLALTLGLNLNIGKKWETKIKGPVYLSEKTATTGRLFCFLMYVISGTYTEHGPIGSDGEAVFYFGTPCYDNQTCMN